MKKQDFFLNQQSEVPLYLQLYHYFVSQIQNGLIVKGQRLPSVRSLAQQLKVSKSTVASTYDKLVSEGYLMAKPKSGYFCDVPLMKKKQTMAKKQMPFVMQKPVPRYDFSSQAIGLGHFESKIWKRYMRLVLEDERYIASYGHPQGEYFLREQLTYYLNEQRGLSVFPWQLVIGAGIQPLLYLFCSMFQGQHLTIGFLKPGFPEAMRVFLDCQHQVVLLDHLDDLNGLDILYLTLDGLKMKLKERMALLQRLKEQHIYLIEDDYNAEMHYRTVAMNSLQGMYGEDIVFYLNSFSKLLLPSVRLACLSVPNAFLEALQVALKAYHQTASKIEQQVFAWYIQDGHLERCVKRLRKTYDKKSRFVETILNLYLAPCDYILLETHLCFEIKGDFTKDFYAALEQKKILVSHQKKDSFRLYFSGISEDDLTYGLQEIFDIYLK